MTAEAGIPKITAEADLKKLAADLSSDDWYTKKHALWTLARHVQLHGAKDVAQLDIFGLLAGGVRDVDDTIRARSIWLVGLLAAAGEGERFRALGADIALKDMLDDDTGATFCPARSGELEWTTIGELARDALGELCVPGLAGEAGEGEN